VAFNQKINFPVLVTIGLAGALLLVVLVTGTQAWFAYEDNNVTNAQIVNSSKSDLVIHRDQQLEDLQKQPPHWADHGKTKIAIPIEQAMHILVDSHGVMPSMQTNVSPQQ